MPRVLVTPPMLRVGSWPYRPVLELAGLEIVYPHPALDVFDPVQLIDALQGCDAVVAGVEGFTAEVQAATKLRVISRVGVGFDAVDVPAATERGTLVTITPGTNEHAVAELAIAMLVALSRGFPQRDREVRRGVWNREILPRMSGRKLGLVGLGRIGRAVTPRAKGLGLHIQAYDPYASAEWAKEHEVELVSQETLFATSDFISLHAPATPENENLINERTLSLMKPNVIIVNTSRGNLIDEPALYDALKHHRIRAAGLDVFKVEPLTADNPFAQLDNVLLSPHVGGLDQESIIAMSTLAAQCVADLYTGGWPTGCVVNSQLEPGWKW